MQRLLGDGWEGRRHDVDRGRAVYRACIQYGRAIVAA